MTSRVHRWEVRWVVEIYGFPNAGADKLKLKDSGSKGEIMGHWHLIFLGGGGGGKSAVKIVDEFPYIFRRYERCVYTPRSYFPFISFFVLNNNKIKKNAKISLYPYFLISTTDHYNNQTSPSPEGWVCRDKSNLSSAYTLIYKYFIIVYYIVCFNIYHLSRIWQNDVCSRMVLLSFMHVL